MLRAQTGVSTRHSGVLPVPLLVFRGSTGTPTATPGYTCCPYWCSGVDLASLPDALGSAWYPYLMLQGRSGIPTCMDGVDQASLHMQEG